MVNLVTLPATNPTKDTGAFEVFGEKTRPPDVTCIPPHLPPMPPPTCRPPISPRPTAALFSSLRQSMLSERASWSMTMKPTLCRVRS